MTTPSVQAALDTLIEAIRSELRDEFLSALGGTAPAPKPGRGRAKRGATSATTTPARARARAKGAKRTPEELEALTKNVLAHIKKNPGQRVEQIAEALGASTKELALPIIKLGKALKTQGQRRGTKYTAR